VGNYLVFGVNWLSTRGYGLFFRVPEGLAKKTRITGTRMSRHDKLWKHAVFRLDGAHVNMAAFESLFEKALEQRME
jgi:hypothetical protein